MKLVKKVLTGVAVAAMAASGNAAMQTIGGVNWDGTPFKIGDLKGNVALLFFGYTNCPDVCPLTMAKLASVYTEVGELATDVRVVMISTDPERDTPAVLEQFVALLKQFFAKIPCLGVTAA